MIPVRCANKVGEHSNFHPDLILPAFVHSETVAYNLMEDEFIGLLGGYKRDQTPRVNANTVPEGNCIDAKTEREYHIMQGFAKALWNVLKQYKEKVKVNIVSTP